jgi:hypothetical protein
MIRTLRALEPQQMRQLIRLLDPRADLDEIDDDEAWEELLATLRRALEIPAKDDLPEFLRRRLVEVVVRQFELADSADSLADRELAGLLADFTLESAQRLAKDDERREEFETFLRTKSRRERLEWLVASQRARAVAADEGFDRREARQTGRTASRRERERSPRDSRSTDRRPRRGRKEEAESRPEGSGCRDCGGHSD